MSDRYLCDTCEKNSEDIDASHCVCWAAPIEKVVVADDDERRPREICPWGMHEERK